MYKDIVEPLEITIKDIHRIPSYESLKDEEAMRIANSLKKLCALIYFLEANKKSMGPSVDGSTSTVESDRTLTLKPVHFKQ